MLLHANKWNMHSVVFFLKIEDKITELLSSSHCIFELY